ncbi:MAG: HNH endonuclease [Actinomycetota bacterium]|nr:HNH endonuclease [Actinomycetota bacterium]
MHGGPTDPGNLILLCRAHHRAVHEGGWRPRLHPDGRVTFTRRRQPGLPAPGPASLRGDPPPAGTAVRPGTVTRR